MCDTFRKLPSCLTFSGLSVNVVIIVTGIKRGISIRVIVGLGLRLRLEIFTIHQAPDYY